MAHFEDIIPFILKNEGGYVNHPADRGGETNLGISRRSYPNENIRDMTEERAKYLYRRDFWNRIGGDNLDPQVALAAMDAAVNHGPGWALKALKETGGDLGKFQQRRREFFQSIIARDESQRVFEKGWMARMDKLDATLREMAPAGPQAADQGSPLSTPQAAPEVPATALSAAPGGDLFAGLQRRPAFEGPENLVDPAARPLPDPISGETLAGLEGREQFEFEQNNNVFQQGALAARASILNRGWVQMVEDAINPVETGGGPQDPERMRAMLQELPEMYHHYVIGEGSRLGTEDRYMRALENFHAIQDASRVNAGGTALGFAADIATDPLSLVPGLALPLRYHQSSAKALASLSARKLDQRLISAAYTGASAGTAAAVSATALEAVGPWDTNLGETAAANFLFGGVLGGFVGLAPDIHTPLNLSQERIATEKFILDNSWRWRGFEDPINPDQRSLFSQEEIPASDAPIDVETINLDDHAVPVPIEQRELDFSGPEDVDAPRTPVGPGVTLTTPHVPGIWRATSSHQMDGQTVLEAIARGENPLTSSWFGDARDPDSAASFAKRLLQNIKGLTNIPLKYGSVKNAQIDYSPYFAGGGVNEVVFPDTALGSRTVDVILHEYAHAATYYKLDAVNKAYDSMPKELREAYDDLVDIQRQIRAALGLHDHTLAKSPAIRKLAEEMGVIPGTDMPVMDRILYATTPGIRGMHELISVLYESNPGVAQILNQIPYKSRHAAGSEPKSLISHAWDAIRKLLGLTPEEGKLLHALRGASDRLLDVPMRGTFPVLNPVTGKLEHKEISWGPESPEAFNLTDVSGDPTAGLSPDPYTAHVVPPAQSAKAHLLAVASDPRWAQNAAMQTMAKRLLAAFRDTDARVVILDEAQAKDQGMRVGEGQFDVDANVIYISEDIAKNPGNFQKLIVHEASHAVTAHKIMDGYGNPDSPYRPLVKELDALRQKVARSLNLKKDWDESSPFSNAKEHDAAYYHLHGDFGVDFGRTTAFGTSGNIRATNEFVSGLFYPSGEYLRALEKVKVGARGKSVVSKVWEVIRDILRFSDDDISALRAGQEVVEEIMRGRPPNKKPFDNDEIRGPNGGVQWKFNSATKDVQIAAQKAGIGRSLVFGWGLDLQYRLLGSKVLVGARDLALKLIGTNVGLKDGAVVKSSAWDETLKLHTRWSTEYNRVAHEQFKKWGKRNGYPWYKMGEAWETFNAELTEALRNPDIGMDPEIAAVHKVARRLLDKDIRSRINNPLLDEGRVMPGLTEREVLDPVTGEVKLVGKLEADSSYMPRTYDTRKWDLVAEKYGIDGVIAYFSKSIRSARPDIDEDTADKLGRWLVETFEEARYNRTADEFGDLLEGRDKEALMQALMRSNIGEAKAKEIIDKLHRTTADDKNAPNSNLKRRAFLDETFELDMPDGSRIRLSDFTHTNASQVLNAYMRRMAGNIAMAKTTGARLRSDYNKLIHDATKQQIGDGANRSDVTRVREDLNFAIDRILGRPLEESRKHLAAAAMFRAYNVIRLMSGAVYNQLVEFGQVMGTVGFKNTLSSISDYRRLMAKMKSGVVDDEVLTIRDIFDSLGADSVARMDFAESEEWTRLMGDTNIARVLDKSEEVLRKGAKAVLDYTGMNPLMHMQRRFHAVAFVNHIKKVATAKNGREVHGRFFTPKRLAGMGLTETDFGDILDLVRANPKVSPIDALDSAPRLKSLFRTALQRESRRVIQENDLPSMIPIMGRGLAQTIFQFQNFAFQAWSKALMFGLHQRDASALMSLLYGGMLASIAYSTRTLLGTIGMDEEARQERLEQRMSMKQIVANSFGRTSQATMLPQLFDIISPYPMFSGMRTTSDVSDLASNPTLQLVNSFLSGGKLIRNAFSDEEQTTQRDVQSLMRTLPLNNMVGMQNVLNAIAAEFPRSRKQSADDGAWGTFDSFN